MKDFKSFFICNKCLFPCFYGTGVPYNEIIENCEINEDGYKIPELICPLYDDKAQFYQISQKKLESILKKNG